MWTYSPQKRQAGSAFALMYRLLRRSCTLIGVFVIPPVPSVLLESLPSSRAPLLHGHYAASQLTTCPSATLSSSTVFLVWPVIRLPCSAIFLGGTRRASPVARYVLVTVLSLPPRRSVLSPRSARDQAMLPSPRDRGLGFRISVLFRGHLWVYFRYGPATCSPSLQWLCRSASSASLSSADTTQVGSEEARLHASLRPPLKLHVRFSRMQLSRRLKTSEMPKRN